MFILPVCSPKESGKRRIMETSSLLYSPEEPLGLRSAAFSDGRTHSEGKRISWIGSISDEVESVMEELIQSLKSQALVAECPRCYAEFPLSDALLFDGRLPFPDEAESRRKEYENVLKEKGTDLLRKKRLATIRAEATAEAVSIGKMVEHLVPILKGFDFKPADCRTLFEPIDLLVLNGLSVSKVDQLAFMEIKTGGAQLNSHQRKIRDAIRDHRVFYEEV